MVGRKCARLRELQVPDTCKAASTRNGKPGQGLLAVCRGCPNLAVLSLPAYKGPESALLELGAARQLRVLCLKGAHNLTDAVIAHVASNCRRIEEMDLSFNAITGQCPHRSLPAACVQLAQMMGAVVFRVVTPLGCKGLAALSWQSLCDESSVSLFVCVARCVAAQHWVFAAAPQEAGPEALQAGLRRRHCCSGRRLPQAAGKGRSLGGCWLKVVP